jgi:hypothetical protein
MIIWVILDIILMNTALFNLFETLSLRYTIAISFAIEVFIACQTGGIHPNIRKAILLYCPFISSENSKELE